MTNFHHYCPIQVRYGDLDPQGHVNNARFLTYTEQTRMSYLIELGLWDGVSFIDLGLIVADIHMSYLSPIHLGQAIQVGVCVTRIGNKSINFEFQLEDTESKKIIAKCETVMVTYDYHTESSIPVPQTWREKIKAFEGL